MRPPKGKNSLRRSGSRASQHSTNNQGEAPLHLSVLTDTSTTELSPTVFEGESSFLLPSPRSLNASSSSSLHSPFSFPVPKFPVYDHRNQSRDNGDNRFFIPASPSVSDVHVEVPDDVQVNVSWKCGDSFHFSIPEPDCNSWEKAYTVAKTHDDAMCSVWKEEIDKMLVFGGLFAATVVAFLVVSYQLLQPTADDIQKATTNMIVNLLRLYANGTLLENNIHFPAPPNNFHPSPAVLRMNAVLFLSMTMALSVVLVGTICLQWICEFQRDPRVTPQNSFAIRQMRRDGFYNWKVPHIIYSLPIVLQLSLVLFFWGLLELLWSLNAKVTVINSVVIAVTFFALVAPLFIPAFQIIFASSEKIEKWKQCPYKSPIARAVANVLFWITLKIIDCIRWYWKSDFQGKKKELLTDLLYIGDWDSDWVSFDNQLQHWRKLSGQPRPDVHASNDSIDISRGLAWLGHSYLHNQDIVCILYHMMRHGHRSTSANALKTLVANDAFSSFLDLAVSKISPHDEGLLTDLYSALLLSHIASSSKDSHLQDAFMSQRTELFIRIANFGAAATARTSQQSSGETPRSFIEECIGDENFGINPFVRNLEYLTKIPEELLVQIVIAFRTYLNEGLEFHGVLWNLTKQIVLHLSSLSVPDRRSLTSSMEAELDSLNVGLSNHLSRIMSRSRHYGGVSSKRDQHDRQRIREYVRAVQSYDHMGLEFSETFRALSEQLS